eukprot:scaffold139047_cov32-Prasinocladus_malaysianus.AAC.2
MNHEVKDFYSKSADPSSLHPWHSRPIDEGPIQPKSGALIQQQILTKSQFIDGCKNYLWVYEFMVLKIANEAVVEGMCSTIAKHASPERGLSFEKYAREAMLHWNMPTQNEADDFLKDALDYHFRNQNGWHFWSHDKKNRALLPIISKVIDRLNNQKSKFFFMK